VDEYPIIDLSHLLPAAQGLARLPADERIQRLRADRWIGYPRAVEALNRLEALYARPNKQRMPNLLLVGPTNNGKSMIVEKFRRAHPASSDADQEHIPVLVVQMLQVGEESGTIEEMLNQLAEHYEDEVDTTLKNLSSIIEPLLLLVIGGVVGLLAMALIMPIYNIGANIK
jgi:predicted Ser/Thr protein kinase